MVNFHFNINGQASNGFNINPFTNRAKKANLPQNTIISATISQKNANNTSVTMTDGTAITIKNSSILGDIGEEIFFELSEHNGNLALKQVFPFTSNETLLTEKASLKSTKELLSSHDFMSEYSSMDANVLSEEKEQLAKKANEAISRIKRNINRLGQHTDTKTMAQLAASGIDISKISIDALTNITSQIDSFKRSNNIEVLNQLEQKLDAVLNLTDEQISKALSSNTLLTLDNLYMVKNSVINNEDFANNITDADFANLKEQVLHFFDIHNLEDSAVNYERARFLVANDIPLDIENFEKLIFLQDIEGNIDLDSLLAKANQIYSENGQLGKLEVYDKDAVYNSELDSLKNQISVAHARLAMSYEANLTLIDTELEMDLEPQIEELGVLKAYEEELLAVVLKQMDVAENIENQNIIKDTYKNIKALKYMDYSVFEQVLSKKIEFNLQNLVNIITAQKYDANRTVAMLKYGDHFANVAQQFAAVLRKLGIDDNEHNIRAAKILSMNNIELNHENLLQIKTIDIKIMDVAKNLHPIIAANMIGYGLNPSSMHMDDILKYIEGFNGKFSKNDSELLYQNIMEMDKQLNITTQVRQKVIEVYQMLHKISKNNGAGIGFAVNAGIELTLQNLMDFSKNYTPQRAANSTDSSFDQNVYYAKHLVSNFIQEASPMPLATFIENESLDEHLEQSIKKLKDIVRNLRVNGELEGNQEIESIVRDIDELSKTSKHQIRSILDRGLPLTLQNIKRFKVHKENKGKMGFEGLEGLQEFYTQDLLQVLQTTELESFLNGATATDENDKIIEKVDNLRDSSENIEVISATNILLKSLEFRGQMLENSHDFSFSMMLNNAPTDVNMHILNPGISLEDGTKVFISLDTTLGHVQGLMTLYSSEVELIFSTTGQGVHILQGNLGYLKELFNDIGIENININFVDNISMKNGLSNLGHLPI